MRRSEGGKSGDAGASEPDFVLPVHDEENYGKSQCGGKTGGGQGLGGSEREE